MPERIRKPKPQAQSRDAKGRFTSAAAPAERSAVTLAKLAESSALLDEIDDLLDDVLTGTTAEEFLATTVQAGGQ